MTVREALQLLGLRPRTVREYVHRGELSGRLIRKRWRFRRDDLAELLGRPRVESALKLRPRRMNGQTEQGNRVTAAASKARTGSMSRMSPRLPTFPAAWTLSDPRGRPYFVFWTSPFDDTLTRILRMESIREGAALPPRAVSDPRVILDEVPDLVDDRQIAPGPD